MLLLLVGAGFVYIFLQVVFEIFSDRSLRPWALLSIVALLFWAGYKDDGTQRIIGFVPICLLLLWFV